MKPTETLHDQGQSLWLDNITRDLLHSGTLERYIAELSVTGLTSNPTIFDPAIKNSSAYDAGIRQKIKEGKSGRGAVLRAGARGSDAGRRSVSTDLGPNERRGRLGVAGSVAAAGPRHGQYPGRGQGPARPGGTTEPPHQDPGHQGRAAGHRGGDLRRHTDQCDAALLARAVPGCFGRFLAWRRAPRGRWARAGGRLGRLGVHQPVADADDGKAIAQQALPLQVVEGRHQLPHGEIPGGPEHHHRARIRHARRGLRALGASSQRRRHAHRFQLHVIPPQPQLPSLDQGLGRRPVEPEMLEARVAVDGSQPSAPGRDAS